MNELKKSRKLFCNDFIRLDPNWANYLKILENFFAQFRIGHLAHTRGFQMMTLNQHLGNIFRTHPTGKEIFLWSFIPNQKRPSFLFWIFVFYFEFAFHASEASTHPPPCLLWPWNALCLFLCIYLCFPIDFGFVFVFPFVFVFRICISIWCI